MNQADINMYRNVFLTAAVTGSFSKIKELLGKGIPVDIPDGLGKTALTYACECGRLETAEFLADAGADINIKDVYGYTPIFYAAQNEKNDVLMFLIKRGADLTVRSRENKGIVSFSGTKTPETIQILHEHGVSLIDDGIDVITDTVVNGHFKTLRYLVSVGLDVNMPDFREETLLMASVKRGYTEITRFLIDSGADIHYRNIDGSSALFYAVIKGRVREAEILVAAGADINRANKRYGSYLTAAVAYKIPDMLRFLLKAGADPDFTDGRGNTAMHRAAEDGAVSLIKILIKAGGNFYAANAKRETPGNLLQKFSTYHRLNKYEKNIDLLNTLYEKTSARRLKLEDSRKQSFSGFEFDI